MTRQFSMLLVRSHGSLPTSRQIGANKSKMFMTGTDISIGKRKHSAIRVDMQRPWSSEVQIEPIILYPNNPCSLLSAGATVISPLHLPSLFGHALAQYHDLHLHSRRTIVPSTFPHHGRRTESSQAGRAESEEEEARP